MPSEPSLKAIAENLRTMVDAFERTAIGQQPITPGGGTTITDVLRFIVPQSEGDLALEAIGGPAGKGIGQLLSIIPMGVLSQISRKDMVELAKSLRNRVPDTTDAGSLREFMAEIFSGPVILDNRPATIARNIREGHTNMFNRGEAFGTDITKGGKPARVMSIDAVAGLQSGMSPDEIARAADVVVPTMSPDFTPPLATLPGTTGAQRVKAAEALQSRDFDLANTIISPESGKPRFVLDEDTENFVDLLIEELRELRSNQ